MNTTQKEMVGGVLHSIGGGKKIINLDTLVVSCFKTFPSKFSMDRFPEYPHFDRVEKTVNVLVRSGLIKRATARHYKLTKKGIDWITASPRVLDLIGKNQKKEKVDIQKTLYYNIDEQQYAVETKKMRRSEAYRKYKAGNKEDVSMIDFMTFMKVDVLAKRDLFDRKVNKIKSLCQRDPELKRLFNFLQGKYGLCYGDFIKGVKQTSQKNNEVRI